MEYAPKNPPPRTLAELTAELDDAGLALRAAQAQTGHARRAETEAINRLNEAQKVFDAKMDEMRANAPRGSDWANRDRRSVEVA